MQQHPPNQHQHAPPPTHQHQHQYQHQQPHQWHPPAHQAPDRQAKELADESIKWLVIALGGFWGGFGWITGPMAWLKGNELCKTYRAMGMQPPGTATGAKIAGIVTTVLTGVILLGVFVLLLVLFA